MMVDYFGPPRLHKHPFCKAHDKIFGQNSAFGCLKSSPSGQNKMMRRRSNSVGSGFNDSDNYGSGDRGANPECILFRVNGGWLECGSGAKKYIKRIFRVTRRNLKYYS